MDGDFFSGLGQLGFGTSDYYHRLIAQRLQADVDPMPERAKRVPIFEANHANR